MKAYALLLTLDVKFLSLSLNNQLLSARDSNFCRYFCSINITFDIEEISQCAYYLF